MGPKALIHAVMDASADVALRPTSMLWRKSNSKTLNFVRRGAIFLMVEWTGETPTEVASICGMDKQTFQRAYNEACAAAYRGDKPFLELLDQIIVRMNRAGWQKKSPLDKAEEG